jgi:hypothetical protein
MKHPLVANLLLSLFLLPLTVNGQKPVILTDFVYQASITDYQVNYLLDPDCNLTPAVIFDPVINEQFKRLDFSSRALRSENISPGTCIWMRFVVDNRSVQQNTFHLQPGLFSTFGEFNLHQRLPRRDDHHQNIWFQDQARNEGLQHLRL